MTTKTTNKAAASDSAIEVRATDVDTVKAATAALRANPTAIDDATYTTLDDVKGSLAPKDRVLLEVAKQTRQAGGLELLHNAADVEDANTAFSSVSLAGTQYQYRGLEAADVTPNQLETELNTTVKSAIGRELSRAAGTGNASKRKSFRFDGQTTEREHSATRRINDLSDGARVSQSMRDAQIAGVDYDFEAYGDGRSE